MAFRGRCDVTSLSLNLVPVREDYTPEHTPTPNGAANRLSHTHSEKGSEGNSARDGGDVKEKKGSIYNGRERERWDW